MVHPVNEKWSGRWAALAASVLVVAIAGLVGSPAAAAAGETNDYAGTAGLLGLGTSARLLALGGAGVAAVADGTAIFYNPAALVRVGGTQLSSMYATQFDVADYLSVGAASGGWGAGLVQLGSAGNEYRDSFGNPTGVFDLSESVVVVGGARQAGAVAIGVAAKYYRQNLPGVKGWGLTADAGVLLTQGPVSLAAVVRNAAGTVVYDNGVSDRFDSEYVFGMAWRHGNLLWVGDFQAPNTLRGGVELTSGRLMLRLGGWSGRGSSAVTAGLGVVSGNLAVDYALQLEAYLPVSHRFSAGIRF